jgi:hypothetical protein
MAPKGRNSASRKETATRTESKARSSGPILLILSLALAMVGSFYIGYEIAGPDLPADLSAEEILTLAKARVSAPVFPPKPAGQEVIRDEPKFVQVEVPRIVSETIRIGPFKTKVPIKKVVTETKTVTQNVKVRTLEGAPPEAIAKWEAETARIQKDYEAAIRREVERVEKARKAQLVQMLYDAQPFIRESLIPLITALTGLIGALATWKWGRKAGT